MIGRPLPGMPFAVADLHVCTGIDQGAAVIPPAPARPPAPHQGWIVLAQCPACNRRTGRYCDRHDVLWVWRGRTLGGENNDAPRAGVAVPGAGRS